VPSTIRPDAMPPLTSMSFFGSVYGMMNAGCVRVHAARTSTSISRSSLTGGDDHAAVSAASGAAGMASVSVAGRAT